MKLYSHPFSSYCQKAIIAFYEAGMPFELAMLDEAHPENGAALQSAWSLGRFPVLDDGGRIVPEATIIIEHLHLACPQARLIPDDAALAVQARLMDRVFDNYVHTPMQAVVADALRPADARDPHGVAAARALLDRSYAWLEGHMATREWAAGDFGLADCAAAPALFYADWVQPIGEDRPALAAYRARLLARPSVARVVDEARPYRPLFPLGAPEGRD